MKVAVLTETRLGERRVALVPEDVRTLGKRGLEVVVPSGVGLMSGVSDGDYEEAGAAVVANGAVALESAQLVLGVNPPNGETVSRITSGAALISFLDPLGNPGLARDLATAGITGLAMELVPRITRAQSMDALSSQATVAGYRAALLAAGHLPKFLPMFTTAAGTIRPAKALVLGAGVAGPPSHSHPA